jgi:hypothetical protein
LYGARPNRRSDTDTSELFTDIISSTEISSDGNFTTLSQPLSQRGAGGRCRTVFVTIINDAVTEASDTQLPLPFSHRGETNYGPGPSMCKHFNENWTD